MKIETITIRRRRWHEERLWAEAMSSESEIPPGEW
jgi:hypothetical protein